LEEGGVESMEKGGNFREVEEDSSFRMRA